MNPRNLGSIKEKLNSVGWFIPPYVSVGFLEDLALQIDRSPNGFSQDALEHALSLIYDAERLASMVLYRYPTTPVIAAYTETISESIRAHFLSLRHVAVGGLIPVVEGAGRRLLVDRGLPAERGIKAAFLLLASKEDVIKRRIGAVDEIVDMFDSFTEFIQNYFYAPSHAYLLADGTNRHAIAHGAYADSEYGRPLNFYKTIASVDFLAFISSLNTPRASRFAPNKTTASAQLAAEYHALAPGTPPQLR